MPAIYLANLGLCVVVSQTQCGDGAVNSRNPQQVADGDNDLRKTGDTTDPGADCLYGTPDDPAAKPCNTASGGAGADTKGKITRVIGNGAADANGIHFRFRTRQRSTTWAVGVNMPAKCPATATWQSTATSGPIVAQLPLLVETTTASATGRFMDLSGDGCAFAGSAFNGATAPGTAGPFTAVGLPVPYAGGCSRTVSVGVALTGAAPLYDVGFVAITPNAAPTQVATQACSCNPTAGCPE